MENGQALTTTEGGPLNAEIMERVLLAGDLAKLTPTQRVSYYGAVCESVGLNPLTKPFDYINLNGKLVLYAKRDATDQLRRRHQISVRITNRELVDDLYVVTAQATDRQQRTDESVGAVALTGLKGEARANGIMKAETKAKRRVTLSICGLGMLDETEVETVPGASIHVESPRAMTVAAHAPASTSALDDVGDQCSDAGAMGITEPQRKTLFATLRENGKTHEQLKDWLGRELGLESTKQLTPAQFKQVLAWARQPA